MEPVTKNDLEALMAREKWTQEQLATAIGASQAAVSQWVSGGRNVGNYYTRRIRELIDNPSETKRDPTIHHAANRAMWEHCVVTKEMFGVSLSGGITVMIGDEGVEPKQFNLHHNAKDPWTSALHEEIERLGGDGWELAAIDRTAENVEYYFKRPM